MQWHERQRSCLVPTTGASKRQPERSGSAIRPKLQVIARSSAWHARWRRAPAVRRAPCKPMHPQSERRTAPRSSMRSPIEPARPCALASPVRAILPPARRRLDRDVLWPALQTAQRKQSRGRYRRARRPRRRTKAAAANVPVATAPPTRDQFQPSSAACHRPRDRNENGSAAPRPDGCRCQAIVGARAKTWAFPIEAPRRWTSHENRGW